jgi:hypothetical protein
MWEFLAAQHEERDQRLSPTPGPLTADDPIFGWVGSLGAGERTTVARDIHDEVADAVDKRV